MRAGALTRAGALIRLNTVCTDNNATKPVFRITGKTRLKPVSSARQSKIHLQFTWVKVQISKVLNF